MDRDTRELILQQHTQGMRAATIANDLELSRKDVIRLLVNEGKLEVPPAGEPTKVREFVLPAHLAAPDDEPDDPAAPVPTRGGGSKRRAARTPRPPKRPELLDDATWLTEAYVAQRRSKGDIAREIGVTVARISEALKGHEIRRPRARRYPELEDRQWLAAQAEANQRVGDIAQALGCSATLVRNTYKSAGIVPAGVRTRPEQLDDPTWLTERYTTQRNSATQIAKELGCTPGTVERALEMHDIEIRRRRPNERLADREWLAARCAEGLPVSGIARAAGSGARQTQAALEQHGLEVNARRPTRYPQLKDQAWLASQAEDGNDPHAIARQLGCHVKTVYEAIRAAGLKPARAERREPEPCPQLDDADWLTCRHHHARRTMAQIAAELDVRDDRVRKALIRHGIERRQGPRNLYRGPKTPAPTRVPELGDRDWMYAQYVTELRNTKDIAAQLRVAPNTVTRWLRRHEIEVRPRKTAYPALFYRHILEPYMEAADEGDTRETIAVRIAADVGCSPSGAELALRNHFGPAERKLASEVLADPEALAALYATRSLAEVAHELEVGETTVSRWLTKHGITKRAPSARVNARPSRSLIPKLNDREWLAAAYTTRSAQSIADELGCSEPAVLGALRRLDIPVRPAGQRTAQAAGPELQEAA